MCVVIRGNSQRIANISYMGFEEDRIVNICRVVIDFEVDEVEFCGCELLGIWVKTKD